jgi:hypothetical protein
VIFRKPFRDREEDYVQFKSLAERLEEVSGEEVPHSRAEFIDYITHAGLEKKLSSIDTDIRINLKDKKKFPEQTYSWLNLRSHLTGAISDVTLYLGGFALISDKVGMTVYGVFTPVLNGMLGVLPGLVFSGEVDNLAPWKWCEPLHTPLFIPALSYYKNKLKNPTYILNKFLSNYQKLEEIEDALTRHTDLSDIKALQKQKLKEEKKADNHFNVIENMFSFTESQKGFSITYDSPNRDDIINFFEYILGTSTSYKPSTSRSQKRKQPKAEEEVETKFINPWSPEIDKVIEKARRKNE